MKELDSIPFSFQRKWSSKCNCCDTVKNETVTYDLKLKFNRSFDRFNKEHRSYLLFFEPTFYSSFSEIPPVLGTNTGTGKGDIEELVKELKSLIPPKEDK